jgi:hypothetical protein
MDRRNADLGACLNERELSGPSPAPTGRERKSVGRGCELGCLGGGSDGEPKATGSSEDGAHESEERDADVEQRSR